MSIHEVPRAVKHRATALWEQSTRHSEITHFVTHTGRLRFFLPAYYKEAAKKFFVFGGPATKAPRV